MVKKSLPLIAAALIVLAAVSSSAQAQHRPVGIITGMVEDFDTGHGLPNISVSASRVATIADPLCEIVVDLTVVDGRFRFTRLVRGEWELTFSGKGYKTVTRTVTLASQIDRPVLAVKMAKRAVR